MDPLDAPLDLHCSGDPLKEPSETCRSWPNSQKVFRISVVHVSVGSPFTYYYQGGFQDKMGRREAALILNVYEHSPKEQIRDAHKKIMLLNHPDRGGSPYLASKINEAKALLEKQLSS